MTPVGDYLKKLLYQYDCLVVPELGAFLTHYVPAAFTETTNQYLPPRKRLAFNEALRLDDGILINYIMLHESVTRDGALRHIGQFVAEIKQQIRATGSYGLDGVGMLTTNEEGKFQFHPELRHNFYAESFGLQPIQAQYCEPTEVPLPVSILPLNANQSLMTLAPAGSAGEGKLLPMPTKRPVWYWAAATLLIGSLATLSYVSVVQPNELLQSNLNPAALLRLSAFLPKTDAVLVTGSTETMAAVADKAVATPTKIKHTPVPVAEKPLVVKPVIPAPVVVVKTPVAVIPAKRVMVSKPVVSTPKRVKAPVAVKPFLVVAGSFSSRSNALGLRRQLIKAGFDEAYLMMPTRRRELIKVAAFGASTLAEADTAMVKIRELTGVPAWLMRTRP